MSQTLDQPVLLSAMHQLLAPLTRLALARGLPYAALDELLRAALVREARRLIGDVVMTEHHCTGATLATESIALAAYTLDSHNCRRFAKDGRVWNKGDVQFHTGPPFPISFRAVMPKRGECKNLPVPLCLSASHIAFGSIRMEPVFMILGQSAATAAALALEEGCTLHNLPYKKLHTQLEKDGQILHTDSPQ